MELLAAFALGIAGSLHCLGMCGPLALALPQPARSGKRALVLGRLSYNAGRVVMYAMLGGLVGVGGTAISIAGAGQSLSIIAGSLMVVMAIVQLALHRSVVPAWLTARVGTFVRSVVGRQLARPHAGSLFIIGLVNGLLPCGLVFTALVGSVATGSLLGAMAFMAAFGVGTIPSMLVASLGASALSISMRQRLRLAAPVLAFLVGGAIIVRGMDLGIPFVSPKITTTNQNQVSSCCSHTQP
jgi:sulfite exporter TauE/SafE